MALVKCKACGKEVSTSAATCPNCGTLDPGKYDPRERRECQECGKEVFTFTTVCPNCGAPEPGKYNPSTVVVVRKPVHLNSALSAKINVDNKYIGSVKNNQTITFDVRPGQRTIKIFASLIPYGTKYTQEFEEGKKYYYELVPNVITGFNVKLIRSE